MGRYRRRYSDLQSSDNPAIRYDMAFRRMKKIKGFYVHLLVYILVNIFIIIANRYDAGDDQAPFWSFETFSTVFFWGIGLVAHGVSVFGRDVFFGKNWEEKKIQEFMEKEKKEKWE